MTTISEFFAEMNIQFSTDFDAFEVYQFEGTVAELQQPFASWPRPNAMSSQEIDLASICQDVAGLDDAREAIGAELQRVASMPGRLLTIISGVHILALLYPAGMLAPLNQRLRKGSRVVVLVAPPIHPLRLPERAVHSDWRTSLAEALGPDRKITHGGV